MSESDKKGGDMIKFGGYWQRTTKDGRQMITISLSQYSKMILLSRKDAKPNPNSPDGWVFFAPKDENIRINKGMSESTDHFAAEAAVQQSQQQQFVQGTFEEDVPF